MQRRHIVQQSPLTLPRDARVPPSPQRGEGRGEGARVWLGVIVGAHGVRGLVKVKSFTADPHAIADYGPLQDESGARSFALHVVSESKGVLLAQIDGVDDRNAAERLKGQRLYVSRTALPEPEEEEFYQTDLIGLAAMARDGGTLGKVVAVHDFGAGASLEVEDAAGKTILVPFTAAAVPEIDVAGGMLIVAPPAELVVTPEPAGEKV